MASKLFEAAAELKSKLASARSSADVRSKALHDATSNFLIAITQILEKDIIKQTSIKQELTSAQSKAATCQNRMLKMVPEEVGVYQLNSSLDTIDIAVDAVERAAIQQCASMTLAKLKLLHKSVQSCRTFLKNQEYDLYFASTKRFLARSTGVYNSVLELIVGVATKHKKSLLRLSSMLSSMATEFGEDSSKAKEQAKNLKEKIDAVESIMAEIESAAKTILEPRDPIVLLAEVDSVINQYDDSKPDKALNEICLDLKKKAEETDGAVRSLLAGVKRELKATGGPSTDKGYILDCASNDANKFLKEFLTDVRALAKDVPHRSASAKSLAKLHQRVQHLQLALRRLKPPPAEELHHVKLSFKIMELHCSVDSLANASLALQRRDEIWKNTRNLMLLLDTKARLCSRRCPDNIRNDNKSTDLAQIKKKSVQRKLLRLMRFCTSLSQDMESHISTIESTKSNILKEIDAGRMDAAKSNKLVVVDEMRTVLELVSSSPYSKEELIQNAFHEAETALLALSRAFNGRVNDAETFKEQFNNTLTAASQLLRVVRDTEVASVLSELNSSN